LHDLLLQDSERADEHFRVLREADMNVAINTFERGMKLAAQSNGREGAWRDDLAFALQRAQDGYAKVPRPEQKIKCYDIMCICFLALRKPNEAAISILHNTRTLLQDDYIMSSLTTLERSVRKSKRLNKADSEVLELLFNSICGAIEVCSKDKGWTVENHRQEFREMFRENEHIRKATRPALFQKWKLIQKHKAGALFWRATSSGIVRFRETLTDLTHSTASEIYPLGSITVVQEYGKYKVVPQTIMYGYLPQTLLMFILLLVVITSVGVTRALSPVSMSTPEKLIQPVKPLTPVGFTRALPSPVSTNPPEKKRIPPIKPLLGVLKKICIGIGGHLKSVLVILQDVFIGIDVGNLKLMFLTVSEMTVKDLFIGINGNLKLMLLTVKDVFIGIIDGNLKPMLLTTVKDLFVGIVENPKVRALFVEVVDNLENPDWWTIQ